MQWPYVPFWEKERCRLLTQCGILPKLNFLALVPNFFGLSSR